MVRSARLLALASLCFFAASCMPKLGLKSKTQSLDNLANGSSNRTINECKGNVAALTEWDDKADPNQNNIVIGKDIAGSLSPEVQAKYKARVKQYLSAVPSEIQKGFLKFGGQIILTGQAEAKCNDTFSKNKGDKPYQSYESADKNGKDNSGNALADSCFIYSVAEPGTPNAGQETTVILHQINVGEIGVTSLAGNAAYDRNEERLLHAGVREFGLIYSQFFSKLQAIDLKKGLVPHSGNFYLGQTDTTEMANVKENLANRFLLDVALAEKTKKYNLDALEPLLGKGSAGLIRGIVSNTKESDLKSLKLLDVASFQYESDHLDQLAGDKVASRKQSRMNQFKDYVMGEGFDSINCSDKSRDVLEKDFQMTKEVLVIANQGIRDFAAKFINGYVDVNEMNQLPGRVTGTTALALEGLFDGLNFQTALMFGMYAAKFAFPNGIMSPAFGAAAASGCVNGVCNLGARSYQSSCTGPNCGLAAGKVCSNCDGGGCSSCSAGLEDA